jgi:hypothetical protein
MRGLKGYIINRSRESESRIGVENRSFAIIIYKVIKEQINLKLMQLRKGIFYIRDLR